MSPLLPAGMKSLGKSCFANCVKLTGTSILHGVKEVPSRAFMGCTSLSVIGLSKNLIKIGSKAFEATVLEKVDFQPTALSMIETDAFKNCEKLMTVCLPYTLNTLENGAFSGCSALDSVACAVTTPLSIKAGVFTAIMRNAKLYVPHVSVNIYKAAPIWKNFSGIGPWVKKEMGNVNNDEAINVSDVSSLINHILCS